MAMVDGMMNKISPGDPLDCNHYELPPGQEAAFPPTPGSLEEALTALAADHDYLLRGDVFTADVIETWIAHKRVHELEPLRRRPHPYEFCMYFDA